MLAYAFVAYIFISFFDVDDARKLFLVCVDKLMLISHRSFSEMKRGKTQFFKLPISTMKIHFLFLPRSQVHLVFYTVDTWR